MQDRKGIEELIAESLIEVLERSLKLENEDQTAISQEFKEWLNGVNKEEDIWVINHIND